MHDFSIEQLTTGTMLAWAKENTNRTGKRK